MEAWQKLRADAEAFFSRLSPRERVMVTAAGAAVAAFVLLLVSMGVSHAIRDRESRIDAKTQVLSQVGQLAQTYRRAQSERSLLEAKLQGPPVQLMSFVSQTGTRLGIEVNEYLMSEVKERAMSSKEMFGNDVLWKASRSMALQKGLCVRRQQAGCECFLNGFRQWPLGLE